MKTIQDVISSEIKGIWGEELSEGEVGIPVIKTNNLRYDGKIDLTNLTLRKLSDKDLASRFLIPGDLLVEKSGGTKTHSVGYVAFFDGIEGKYVANNFIMVLRPNCKLVVAKYLFYQMRYMYETGRFEDCYNKTTGIQNLKAKVYLGKPICLPQTEKQTRIAHLLDIIQNGISLATEQICSLDEQVKSLFNEMFGDPVFDTQNRGTKPLSDYIVSIKYGTSQPPKFSPKGKYKFIRATNIKNGRIVEKDMLRIDEIEAEKISKCKLKFGDFIMVRSGAFTGDTCVISNDYEGDYAGYDIIVTFDQTRLNPVFLNALVNTDYMTKVVKPMTGRAAQPHINSAQVSSLPILNVSKSEQDKFVNTIEQIDKLRFI